MTLSLRCRARPLMSCVQLWLLRACVCRVSVSFVLGYSAAAPTHVLYVLVLSLLQNGQLFDLYFEIDLSDALVADAQLRWV